MIQSFFSPLLLGVFKIITKLTISQNFILSTYLRAAIYSPITPVYFSNIAVTSRIFSTPAQNLSDKFQSLCGRKVTAYKHDAYVLFNIFLISALLIPQTFAFRSSNIRRSSSKRKSRTLVHCCNLHYDTPHLLYITWLNRQ